VVCNGPSPALSTDRWSANRIIYCDSIFGGSGPWRIDSGLMMQSHVRQTVSRCFAVLRQLRTVRRQVPTSVFQSLIVALVLSRLDYCNSVLVGLPTNLIQHLQSVQDAAARLTFRIRRSEHITPALISLHWLRVPERISFKLAVLTYDSCVTITIHHYCLDTRGPCNN